MTCWGTGQPRREFLYVDDLARACVFLMEHYSEEQFVNVGSGSAITIKELAETIQRIIGFAGEIEWDTSKPDDTPTQAPRQLAALRPRLETAGHSPDGHSARVWRFRSATSA